jgi:hypothetical protein
MTTVVAIFDNARDVDQAVTRLARAGFEDAVYDEGIIAAEAHSLGLVFAPGSAPAVVWGTPESDVYRKQDHHAVVRAFKAHLADYHLPDQVIEAYAATFSHSGEFLLLKSKSKRVQTAIEILQNSGATRVAKHD